ncbi:c-type cytochrome [Colwellia sp. TT2012]|uniref:c-type cytochrome n=1 Tax=Colwellia sp. TT2012 TaxID=1720342 RepID=UPI00070B774C|nr:cytochrome c [Colwellia sp. TT2012]
MHKLKLALIAGVSFIILMGGISQRHIIECQLITPSGYLEIEPNIFFCPSINNIQSDELLSNINLAKSRINNTFGNMTSSPKVIITVTENEAVSFGSNPYGVTHLSVLGQCIVLGPEGQNIDVIAQNENITPIDLDESPISGDASKGKKIFSKNCASCHGAEGEGITAPALGDQLFLSSATDSYLKHAIVNGRDGTPMQSFNEIIEVQGINDVVAYLRS